MGINLNLHEVHGLHQPGGGGQGASIEDPAGGGDDLSTC